MDTKRLIVELINKNDGKWTWYQLERGLSLRGLGGQVNSVLEAEELVSDGLLAIAADPAFPAPLYFVTAKGKRFIEH